MQLPGVISTLLRWARGVVAEVLGVLVLLIGAVVVAIVTTAIF